MADTTERKEADWKTIDWSDRDSVVTTFPFYLRERLRLEKTVKKLNNQVNIELFTLQTPFKDQTLLKDTSLFLEANKRLCLYGGNGTGKTLLFERMADAGIKGFPTHLHVHHCKEMEHVENAESVLDTVVHSHKLLGVLLKCEAHIKAAMENAPEDKMAGLKSNLNYIEAQLRAINAETARDRASKMLRAVGFDEDGQARSTNDLSGGLRMRVALCVAFFVDADLLLMDEPTNHLDFPSVLWLENRLRGYSKSFLIVSHDRDLLNNVTTGVLLLSNLKINVYECGFKEFEVRRAKEDKKRSVEIEKFLKLNRNADPSTMLGRQVADKRAWSQEYYERTVRMQGKFTFPAPVQLEPFGGEKGDDVSIVNIKDVRFSYAPEKGNFIFDNPINFNVRAGSRVGIMGPNGAGKSTLLKLITKKLTPTEGTCTWHPNFVLAYFGQHSTAELDMEKTPMEFMMEQFPDVSSGKLRSHLSKTGVSGGKESTRMKGLSYSQRSCVIFSKLTFVSPHLLIMDEPTNFLDIDSVDSLIAAANKFQGALLVVTHSRHFLRKCAKTYLSVVPGRFEMYDSMDDAEKSTYTFMQELESGVKIDASDLAAGGGSLHSGAGAVSRDKPKTVEGTPPKFAVGEQVQGLWTDKKFHDGVIRNIRPGVPNKYSVFYEEFGKAAVIPERGIKKMSAQKAQKNLAKEKAIAAKEAEKKSLQEAKKIKWSQDDKCLAQFSDGKWYEASITRVNAFDMFVVTFVGVGDGKPVTVAKKKLRAFDAAIAATASKPKSQGRQQGGRGRAPGKQGQRGPTQGRRGRQTGQRKQSTGAA